MAKYILNVCVTIATYTHFLFGQDITPLQADRPDQTETPYTVPKNHFQMENGFLFEQSDEDNAYITHPSVLFKYGITDKFELGIITEFSTATSHNLSSFGLNPATLRFKQNITMEDGIVPVTSFIGYLSIPHLATENQYASYFAPAFRFTMQHTLSEKFSLGYNIGTEWDGESPEPVFIYTITSGYSISENTGAYAELFGYLPQISSAQHLFDGGINYLIQQNILIDISAGFGLNKNTLHYYSALGISFRLPD